MSLYYLGYFQKIVQYHKVFTSMVF